MAWRYAFIAGTCSLLMAASPGISEAQDSMAAISMRDFGSPDVLVLGQVPRPRPGPNELLVHVRAAGVNPIDTGIRSGRAGGMVGARLPYVPGFDVSGVVEEVGPGVTAFSVGDEVFAMLDLRRGGGYAEYALVKTEETAPKPPGMTHAEAASLPLVSLTAWQALFETAELKEGQVVLIHAGAGGVGSMAIQLARWRGARVIATASPQNHEFLRELGADVVVDYNTERFEDVAGKVDVVLDPIGGETQVRSLSILKEGGILVSLVGLTAEGRSPPAGVRAQSILVHPDSSQLRQIAELVAGGQLHPVVSYRFPLADAAAAHRQSESRHTRGKIVLLVDPAGPGAGRVSRDGRN